MEEAMRLAQRLAEEERLAKLAQERAARRFARMANFQRLVDDVNALERSCKKFAENQDAKVREAEQRNAQARDELETTKKQLESDQKRAIDLRLAEKAEQECLLAEKKKLIAYLKQENHKARTKEETVRMKLNKAKALNERLSAENKNTQKRINAKSSVQRKRDCLDEELDRAKAFHCTTKDEVAKRQQMYMDQARARLQLQKALATVMSAVQENCLNRNLVEETCVTALLAESYSKSVMQGLDVATLMMDEPDLTGSDVSDSGSVY
jgi:hypothetical protein